MDRKTIANFARWASGDRHVKVKFGADDNNKECCYNTETNTIHLPESITDHSAMATLASLLHETGHTKSENEDKSIGFDLHSFIESPMDHLILNVAEDIRIDTHNICARKASRTLYNALDESVLESLKGIPEERLSVVFPMICLIHSNKTKMNKTLFWAISLLSKKGVNIKSYDGILTRKFDELVRCISDTRHYASAITGNPTSIMAPKYKEYAEANKKMIFTLIKDIKEILKKLNKENQNDKKEENNKEQQPDKQNEKSQNDQQNDQGKEQQEKEQNQQSDQTPKQTTEQKQENNTEGKEDHAEEQAILDNYNDNLSKIKTGNNGEKGESVKGHKFVPAELIDSQTREILLECLRKKYNTNINEGNQLNTDSLTSFHTASIDGLFQDTIRKSTRKGKFYFLIDTSSSMRTCMLGTSNQSSMKIVWKGYLSIKEAIKESIEEGNDVEIATYGFARGLYAITDDLMPEPCGGTYMAMALKDLLEIANQDAEQEKLVIMVTDGGIQHSDPDDIKNLCNSSGNMKFIMVSLTEHSAIREIFGNNSIVETEREFEEKLTKQCINILEG